MHTDNTDLHRRSNEPGAADWQDVLNVIPVAAYVCEPGGQITFFNALAETVWGRAPQLRAADELYCGSHQLYLSDGTPISHQQCWMALCLIEGSAYHGREIVIERHDGSRTLGRAYAHPVRNAHGEVIGAVNLVAEVSAQSAPDSISTSPHLPLDAQIAIIEIAVPLFAALPWEKAAFHSHA